MALRIDREQLERMKKRLILVGNKPFDCDRSTEIDAMDFVVRVNRMNNYGLSGTTSRTITAKVLKAAILKHTSDLVNGGAYNSTSKKIELKHGSTVVAEIDAAPFIVDGMVDDVRIENGNLIIDFNTESGKQDIAIPLTDIFDPSNYYTKTQTDVLLSGKAETADLEALIERVAALEEAITPQEDPIVAEEPQPNE